MTHIGVNELGHHWFRWWLGACWAPSHYMNQCWLIVILDLTNRTEILIKVQNYYFKDIHFKMLSTKRRPFCSDPLCLINWSSPYKQIKSNACHNYPPSSNQDRLPHCVGSADYRREKYHNIGLGIHIISPAINQLLVQQIKPKSFTLPTICSARVTFLFIWICNAERPYS